MARPLIDTPPAPGPDPAPRRVDAPWTSWALAAAFWVLYLPTCARVVQGGDSPEFLTVAAAGGVAHPPGYPLFSLLASLFVDVLPGSDAFAVSALSALLAAATIGVLHRAVLRATARGEAALVAAVALGFSELFWRWSVVPEVLSGSTLTAALVVAVAVRSATGAAGPRQGLLVGLAFATGIAHHHTAILLAPILVYAWLAAAPRDLRGFSITTAAAGLGALAGLIPYLLLLAPGGAWRWGDTTTFEGLVHHFLRADYGTFSTGRSATEVGAWVQPWLYLGGLGRQFPGLPVAVGLLGFVVAFRARTGKGLALALAATWLLAGPLFVTQFDLPAEGYYRVVVERFHSFPNVLFATAIGLGAAAVLAWPRWSRPAVPIGLLAANLAVAGGMAGPRASMSDATILDDFLRNTLGAVEPDAVVVSHGDTFNFGCVYAQEVLALRPDVACLSPKMLGHRWYRDRITARHPDLVLQEGGVALQLPEFVVANADRRPVYISVRIPLVAPEVVGIIPPTWPAAGTLLRVSGRGQFPPPPDVVEAALMRDWDGFVLRSSLVDEAELDEVLESTVWDHYGLVWTTLASGYAFSGEDAGRLRCEARARELSPWLLASRP